MQRKCHTQEKEKSTILLTQKYDHHNRIESEHMPCVTHIYANSVSARIRLDFNITKNVSKIAATCIYYYYLITMYYRIVTTKSNITEAKTSTQAHTHTYHPTIFKIVTKSKQN